jgi:hypothetical protein
MLGQSVEYSRWVRRASVWACHGDARREYWRRTTEGFSKIEHFDPLGKALGMTVYNNSDCIARGRLLPSDA